MAKKSTVVYTVDMLVHVELAEGTAFKAMQDAVKAIKQVMSRSAIDHPLVRVVDIEKTVIQKKVTY